ncbi:MAG: hypothetical protein AAF658_00030 [Myxococcota bacterium]
MSRSLGVVCVVCLAACRLDAVEAEGTSVAPPYTARVLGDAPIAYFTFDEGPSTQPVDASGRNGLAVVSGASSLGTPPATGFGRALTLNDGGRLSLPGGATTLRESGTLELWFAFHSWPTQSERWLRVGDQAELGFTPTGALVFAGVAVAQPAQISVYEWHHVALSYADGFMTLSVDSVQQGVVAVEAPEGAIVVEGRSVDLDEVALFSSVLPARSLRARLETVRPATPPCPGTESAPVVTQADGAELVGVGIASVDEPAIRIDGARQARIENVVIAHRGAGPAIELQGTVDVVIRNVVITTEGGDGSPSIVLRDAQSTVIEGVTLNGGGGIQAEQSARTRVRFVRGSGVLGPVVELSGSDSSAVEDVEVESLPPGVSSDFGVRVSNSTPVELRRVLVAGSDGPEGAAFDLRFGDARAVVAQDLLALGQPNQCFRVQGVGLVLTRTGCADTVCTDLGRGVGVTQAGWSALPGSGEIRIDGFRFNDCFTTPVTGEERVASTQIAQREAPPRRARVAPWCVQNAP